MMLTKHYVGLDPAAQYLQCIKFDSEEFREQCLS